MTEEASPGILTRIEVVEPPYWAPYVMPNNMIKYASGGACSARGKSNAMAPAGPSPGSTPTKVPSNTPANPYNRLSGEAAVRMP
jgi:hypothetical protein